MFYLAHCILAHSFILVEFVEALCIIFHHNKPVYVEELMIATKLKEDYDKYPSCRQQVQRCDNDMLVRHNYFFILNLLNPNIA